MSSTHFTKPNLVKKNIYQSADFSNDKNDLSWMQNQVIHHSSLHKHSLSLDQNLDTKPKIQNILT